MKIPKRIQPLIDDGIVDAVISRLMSGKEADVFIVRCGEEIRCAKVYKEAMKRSFKQAVTYQEGRKVRNTRRNRAMEKGSKYGRKQTEEIWQSIGPMAGKTGDTIMHQPYPVADQKKINPQSEADIDWLQRCILGLRQIRGEMDISPAKPLDILVQDADEADRKRLDAMRPWLFSLGRIQSLEFVTDDAPESAMSVVGNMKLLVPMAGLIDKDAELARLDKQIAKLEKELAGALAKLSNSSFIDRAPAEIVAKAREQAQAQQQNVDDLKAQREKIQAL